VCTPIAASPERCRLLLRVLLAGLIGLTACARQNVMAPRPTEPACRSVRSLQAAQGTADAEGVGDASVRWYSPGSADMQHKLERWCATVGPAVIDPAPARELARAATDAPLTVMSWNAAVGGGDLLEFLARELDLDCSDGAPRPGPGFSHFALLLQEAHRVSGEVPVPAPNAPFPKQIDPAERPGPMLDVTEVAARCGLALVYIPSARNGQRAQGERREDKGNAILASLPLSDFIAIELPLEASRKVAVAASLELPGGGRLRVVDVHFDVSAGLARMLVSGNSWRLEQATAVIEAIELADGAAGSAETGALSVATLVAGDFNVWSKDNSALKLFRREYPESPAWTGRQTRGAFPPDHLFFKQATDGRVQLAPGSFRRIEDRYYSDHHGLAVQVITRR
jgi:endonuclease/exonuclease/phosphatase family metal-dependent hydrolase